MTTMNPLGLKVCEQWNEQNTRLHIKHILTLVSAQEGEDSNTAEKNSLPTALSAQAFVQ